MSDTFDAPQTSVQPVSRRREAKRFGKFMVVGAIGAVVDFTSLNVLLRIFNVIFPVAQAISFSLAVTSNFIWNRFWTYPESRSKPIRKQLTQFFALNIIGLLIRTPIALALNQPFQDLITSSLNGPFAGLTRFATETLHATIEQLGNNAAVACAVIIVMLWNFFSNRFITYNDVKFGH